MSGKINWGRAKKFNGKQSKYETGTELSNGAIVVNDKPDQLAKRAAQVERQWRKKRGLMKDLTLHPNIQKARNERGRR